MDESHAARPAKASVDEPLRRGPGQGSYKACTAYGDFRELIHRKDIDAVVNCTPDHWHVIPAIMAAKAGKDVICEKPLTLTVAEGRLLCEVIKKTGRIFQTASENRSIDTYIQLCELVRNGRIGQTQAHQRVAARRQRDSRRATSTNRRGAAGPEGLQLRDVARPGAAWPPTARPLPRQFPLEPGLLRRPADRLGRSPDRPGPVGQQHRGHRPGRGRGQGQVPAAGRALQHRRGVRAALSIRQRRDDERGQQGAGHPFRRHRRLDRLHGWRAPLEASNPAILESQIGPNEVHLYRPSEVVARTEGCKGGEHRNFIDCVKSRKPCYAPAETGHRTITIAHIGNIAMLLGRKLRWDPQAERFVDDAEANAMLSRKQREPWTIANIDSWLKG